MMMITMRSDRQFVSNKQSKSFDNFFPLLLLAGEWMMTFNKMERQMEFQSTSKTRAEVECSDAQMALKTHSSFSCWNFLPRTTFFFSFSLLSIVSVLLFSFRGWCWLCSRSHNSLRSSFAAPFFESEEKNIKINLTSLLHCTNKNKTNFDFASRVLIFLFSCRGKMREEKLEAKRTDFPIAWLFYPILSPVQMRGSAELSTLSWRCSKASEEKCQTCWMYENMRVNLWLVISMNLINFTHSSVMSRLSVGCVLGTLAAAEDEEVYVEVTTAYRQWTAQL